MSAFVPVKALAGSNFVRADQVVAVAATETSKCNIYLIGGVTVPCNEPAKDVIARIEAATTAGDGRESK